MDKKKTWAERKKQRKIQQLVISCAIVIIVVSAGVVTTRLTHNMDTASSRIAQTAKQLQTDETNEINLVMVGDNLLHLPLVRNAETPEGSYNFDSLYEKMRPHFQGADISVIVQETVLGGEEFGYSGYPLFNSPQEVGDAIAKAGFDVVLHATNHTLDQGEKGIQNTLNFWKKYPDMHVLGIHETESDYNTVHYIEKNGIKLAVLNYTDSVNGMPIPANRPYLIDTVNQENLKKHLAVAESTADFTVVFMHWGTEYSFTADEKQKTLAQFMCENGADLIMGSHPHVIQPVEWVEATNGNRALVFYSLGNYVSRQKEANNLLGIMGKVKICSSEPRGAHIASASVMPTVTHYNTKSRGFYVYPLKNYTDELAASHGVNQYDGKVSVERFRNIFEQVFAENTAVALDY